MWTVDEVDEVLGADDGGLFRAAFGVTSGGNFSDPHHPDLTGRNVLTNRFEAEALAAERSMSRAELEGRLAGLRTRMFEARDQRVYPGLDHKVLTSWNGLMLGAISEAARVFDVPEWRAAAVANAGFLRSRLWIEHRLCHTYKDGVARIDGMLEDYAYLTCIGRPVKRSI